MHHGPRPRLQAELGQHDGDALGAHQGPELPDAHVGAGEGAKGEKEDHNGLEKARAQG